MDRRQTTRHRGAAMVEWIVAAPLVLLVGLAGLQWALVFQARHALEYATHEAVRRAVLHHGQGQAINGGLASGLRAFWLMPTEQQAHTKLMAGLQARWISWQRLAPSAAVFSDFAQAARTRNGEPIANEKEIPNDNLRFRNQVKGAASAISVQDANRFRLQVNYGLPLQVPVVGALIARSMEMYDGCATPVPLQLILAKLGKPAPGLLPRPDRCAMYRARAASAGKPVWRLPVSVAAQGWMQSPLQKSAALDSQTFLRLGMPAQLVLTEPQQANDPLSAPRVVANDSPGAPGSSGSTGAGNADPADGGASTAPGHGSLADELRGVTPGTQPGACTS